MGKIGVLTFSPTGSTNLICKTIAENIRDATVEMLNITLPDSRTALFKSPSTIVDGFDHILVGVPVYAGKIPAFARGFLETIPGKGKDATAVVVYGNNDFGIALKSLVELLLKNHFTVVSAGAFIGQHTYSGDPPVAVGRPDKQDLEKAKLFGKTLGTGKGILEAKHIPAVPSIFTRMKGEMAIKPSHKVQACIQCGECSLTCPVGIIENPTGEFISPKGSRDCLGCLACVKTCKHGGRILQVSGMKKFMGKMILSKASKNRREPLTIPAG